MTHIKRPMLFSKKMKSICLLKSTFLLLFMLQLVSNNLGQSCFSNNSETNLVFEKLNYTNSSLHANIRPFLPDDSLICAFQISDKMLDSKIFGQNLIEFGKGAFKAAINPVLTIAPSFDADSSGFLSDYKLGLSIQGKYGKKVTFGIAGYYGIQSFSTYLKQFIDSTNNIPGNGKYLSKKGENYHYLSINGYLSYSPWKELNLQAGIGRHFFGDGYRSLFLSENAPNYPYAKATASVWKFKYVWMFGALKDPNSDETGLPLKNKLFFTHYLSWNATKWLNINFFEAIVSNPVDSVGVTYFNINYLNPVIFFRPTEFSGGSADNALLGIGGKIKLWGKYHIYSQLIIDEFVLAEIKSGNDWWGNKYGIQVGVKMFDLFQLKNLFGRMEYNLIRPYTYSYSNSIGNYGNLYHPLAHPSGANTEELIGQLHYHKNRYFFEINGIFSVSGFDTTAINYGKDIYKSYETRQSDYGNLQGQGARGSLIALSARASYLLNPKMKLRLDLSMNYLQYKTPAYRTSTIFISFGIKTLLYNFRQDFL